MPTLSDLFTGNNTPQPDPNNPNNPAIPAMAGGASAMGLRRLMANSSQPTPAPTAMPGTGYNANSVGGMAGGEGAAGAVGEAPTGLRRVAGSVWNGVKGVGSAIGDKLPSMSGVSNGLRAAGSYIPAAAAGAGTAMAASDMYHNGANVDNSTNLATGATDTAMSIPRVAQGLSSFLARDVPGAAGRLLDKLPVSTVPTSGMGLRFAGAVPGAAVATTGAAIKSFNQPTSQMAQDTGRDYDQTDTSASGFMHDLGTRALGTMQNVGNAITLGGAGALGRGLRSMWDSDGTGPLDPGTQAKFDAARAKASVAAPNASGQSPNNGDAVQHDAQSMGLRGSAGYGMPQLQQAVQRPYQAIDGDLGAHVRKAMDAVGDVGLYGLGGLAQGAKAQLDSKNAAIENSNNLIGNTADAMDRANQANAQTDMGLRGQNMEFDRGMMSLAQAKMLARMQAQNEMYRFGITNQREQYDANDRLNRNALDQQFLVNGSDGKPTPESQAQRQNVLQKIEGTLGANGYGIGDLPPGAMEQLVTGAKGAANVDEYLKGLTPRLKAIIGMSPKIKTSNNIADYQGLRSSPGLFDRNIQTNVGEVPQRQITGASALGSGGGDIQQENMLRNSLRRNPYNQ